MKINLIGKPIPKKRARHSSRGKFVVTYDPQQIDKENVRKQIIDKVNEALNSDDKQIVMEASKLARINTYCVDLWFYMPINDSDSMTQKNAKLWGFILPNCKPDYDNLEKFYLDCANGVLWKDDCMIVEGKAHKRYGEPARVEIEVMEYKGIKLKPETQNLYKIMSPWELDNLLSAASRLAHQNLYNFYDLEEKSKECWMEETASILLDFSRKYADKLKKISKIDGEK